MALIAVCGQDRALLERWSAMARDLGHHPIAVAPSSLCAGLSAEASLCLYDLGPRGGADPGELPKAVGACPDTLFIAMTAYPQAQEGLRLLRSGVRGYCNRLLSPQVMEVLLATVQSGEIWAGRQVTDYLLGAALSEERRSPPGGDSPLGKLTARESEIAEQVGAGLSNKVIAIENGISERTVKAHLNSIFRKTGIRNRVQLALAVAQGAGRPRQLSNA